MKNNTVEKNNIKVKEERGARAFFSYIYDALITVFGESSEIEEDEALKKAIEKAGISADYGSELLSTAKKCNNATAGGISNSSAKEEYANKIKIEKKDNTEIVDKENREVKNTRTENTITEHERN